MEEEIRLNLRRIEKNLPPQIVSVVERDVEESKEYTRSVEPDNMINRLSVVIFCAIILTLVVRQFL